MGLNSPYFFSLCLTSANPPYQQESIGNNESDTPIYNYFLEAAYEISNKVEMIHPARFLFNAGYTPKTWNEKMLSDKHLKLEKYVQKSADIFPNTDIKGGVAITYHDIDKDYEPIGVFTVYSELTSILKKVSITKPQSLENVISNRGLYKYSDDFFSEKIIESKLTSDRRIAPSSFERMPSIFTKEKPLINEEYIRIYGNMKNERVFRWINKRYVQQNSNLEKYKVLVPKANGTGVLGEALSTPVIIEPLIGFTETYISINETYSKECAEATLKYIKTKFARVMLGVLKVTQNNAKPTWHYVPLQDFTSNSDIYWSKSIHEIDLQLYKKYELDDKEIEFIETHVKEME